ncbi:MAG: 30S ribosomal protein S16 [Candidatus Magasanikbacteria bacterium]|nr:30S ribosomal protein S16 [Candidatus Magasanikbacteria bacterium]
MLTIRLQRLGKRKQPSYRLVVSEKTRDPQAKSLEILGFYNPIQKPKLLELKKDRIKHWIGLGAECSNTIFNLLVKEGLLSGEKRKSIRISKKRTASLEAEKAKQVQAQPTTETAANTEIAEGPSAPAA